MNRSQKAEAIYSQISSPDTKLGDLRKIAKEIKKDHALAMELWSTEGFKSRQLAILIMDKKLLSQDVIDQLDQDMQQHDFDERNQLADWFMANQLMKNQVNSQQLILRPSKLKIVFMLLLSLLFVAGGIVSLDKDSMMGWVIIIFFGLCALVFILQLLPNTSYLKLTEEGFEVRSLFRSNMTKWSEVKGFRTGYISVNKTVTFDYTKNHTKQQNGKKLAKALAGTEGALPDTYGMKASELARLMNEWKESKNGHLTLVNPIFCKLRKASVDHRSFKGVSILKIFSKVLNG
jgi:hypothetical protein